MGREHTHKHPRKRRVSFLNLIPAVFVLLAAVAFIIKFGGPSILKLYIQAGIGDCTKIPILCMVPQDHLDKVVVDRAVVDEFTPHDFPKMSIAVPQGFAVTQETVKKVYYKKRWQKQIGPIIYVLCQEPNFFIDLYPQMKKKGITNDYEFIKRVMFSRFSEINTLDDAFFVVLKGIFLPDLGNQPDVKMAQFSLEDTKGFISYNFTKQGNLFACDLVSGNGSYFKLYIKDRESKLTLEKVFGIISTLKAN